MHVRVMSLLVAVGAALAVPASAMAASADISTGLSHTPDPVREENNAQYTLAVTNHGPDTASSVHTTMDTPSGAMFASFTSISQGIATNDSTTTTVNFGDIASGATATLVMNFTHPVPGSVVFRPSSTTTTPDPDHANDSTTDTATVTGLTVSPASFGDQILGTIGPQQTITVTNRAGIPAALGTSHPSGADRGDFLDVADLDTCSGQTLAVDATCQVALRFAPGALGARTASASFPTTNAVDAAAGALSGNGVAPPAVRGPTERLVVVAVASKLRARAGRRVTFRYVSTTKARVTLAVLKGRKRVALVRGRAHVGHNRLRWNGRIGRRAARAGAYRLRLTARSGAQTATAVARLTLTRR